MLCGNWLKISRTFKKVSPYLDIGMVMRPMTGPLTPEIHFHEIILFAFHEINFKYYKMQRTKAEVGHKSHINMAIFFPPSFWFRWF
jgi:hypothetical protein